MPMHRCFVCFFFILQQLPTGKYPGFSAYSLHQVVWELFCNNNCRSGRRTGGSAKKIREQNKKRIGEFPNWSESGSYLVSHQRLPRIIGQWRWLVISQTSIYSNEKSKCLVQHKISQELQKLNYTSVTQVKFTCQSCFSWLSCLSFAKGLPKWRAHFK